jgi:HAD superfamily hydrolase (TIGR01509 family)
MAEIRAVLLDAGGTLIHPDHEFLLDLLAKEGVTADESAYGAARRYADAVIGEILRSDDPGTDDDRIRAWFATLFMELGLPAHRLEAVGQAVAERHAQSLLWVRPVPGTREMLHGLRDMGLRLAVVSNADGRVDQYLSAAGLDQAFEFVLDSGILGIEKPDPRIFELALERLGVAADETVYVGDTWEIDIEGARAAGIRPVYVADEPRDGVTWIPDILDLPAALGIEEH